jgi:hypothetical protein
MEDAASQTHSQYKLDPSEWVGFVLLFASCASVFITQNFKISLRLTLLGGLVISLGYWVKKAITPAPTISLLASSHTPKPEFRYGPLFWAGVVLGFAALVSISFQQRRTYAVLMMAFLTAALLNRLDNQRMNTPKTAPTDIPEKN